MVNLLLFIANTYASDVYEICRHEKQHWNDREQKFETKYVSTFYSREPMQLIIHKNIFEMNRDKRTIMKTFPTDIGKCWREHANSTLCFDDSTKQFEWDFFTYNGNITRDLLTVCFINGERVD